MLKSFQGGYPATTPPATPPTEGGQGEAGCARVSLVGMLPVSGNSEICWGGRSGVSGKGFLAPGNGKGN